MNQITLPFDFGQEIFIVLNENKIFKTKVKNYTVYDDSIFVGTPNGEFNVKDCFATFDDYSSKSVT